jgi:hypothetical protein
MVRGGMGRLARDRKRHPQHLVLNVLCVYGIVGTIPLSCPHFLTPTSRMAMGAWEARLRSHAHDLAPKLRLSGGYEEDIPPLEEGLSPAQIHDLHYNVDKDGAAVATRCSFAFAPSLSASRRPVIPLRFPLLFPPYPSLSLFLCSRSSLPLLLPPSRCPSISFIFPVAWSCMV